MRPALSDAADGLNCCWKAQVRAIFGIDMAGRSTFVNRTAAEMTLS